MNNVNSPSLIIILHTLSNKLSRKLLAIFQHTFENSNSPRKAPPVKAAHNVSDLLVRDIVNGVMGGERVSEHLQKANANTS